MTRVKVVVRQAAEVECLTDEDGDVLLTRLPHEWEGREPVSILIPRACVRGLIEHLRSLLADGDSARPDERFGPIEGRF